MDEFDTLVDWINATESEPPGDGFKKTVLIVPAADAPPRAVETNVQSRFRPLRELGRGGMSSVHDTEDLTLLRNTVLKVMHPEVAAQASMYRQFIIEARITAQLDHPNIIPIYEFGQDMQGVPYINMRKVTGDTLEALIYDETSTRLSADNLKRVARILARVCEALAYAHNRAVVHRDLKPSNIMLGHFGEVYVMDWGVAISRPQAAAGEPVPITSPGEGSADEPLAAGSPSYLAPEQTLTDLDQLGPWTDVFLLGASLYHVLAGVPPYGDEGSLQSVLAAARRCDHLPLHARVPAHLIPAGLARIVDKAMAAEPDARYPSVDAMRIDLEAFIEGRGQFAEVHHAAGDVIVQEGDVGDCAYVIRAGSCRVFRHVGGEEETVSVLGPGEVFGEVAILSGAVRTNSVQAETEVVLEVVTREALTGSLGEDSTLGMFVSALARRFVDLDQRVRLPPHSDGSDSDHSTG